MVRVSRLGAGVGDAVGHPNHVTRQTAVDDNAAIALDIPARRQPRADARVVGDLGAALVGAVVGVVAQTEVDGEPIGYPPRVVDEQRVGLELVALRWRLHVTPDDVVVLDNVQKGRTWCGVVLRRPGVDVIAG